VSTPEKQNQTISFAELEDRTFGDEPITLSATASSGLPVSFRLVSGPATLEDNVLPLTGAGEVVVQALQGGNDTYNAAPPVQRSFFVQKAPQTIAFAQIPDKTCGDAPFALTATATSGLPVSFSVVSGPATLDGNTLTITGAGEVTVRAAQPGNASFMAAEPVERSFTVGRAIQAITVPQLPSFITVGDAPLPLLPTSSSGLPVMIQVVSGPLRLDGNNLIAIGPGGGCISFSQPGDNNFLPATTVERCVEIREPSADEPRVVSFTLVNADTNEDIMPIREGDVVDYAQLPILNLSIRANTEGPARSVVFRFNRKQVQIENHLPFAIAGDDPQGNYNPWVLPAGQHTLTATPYQGTWGKGAKGTAHTVNFTVIGHKVVGFTLINADTDQDLQPLREGDVIDLSALPTRNLNVRAEVRPAEVGSLMFHLNGKRVATEHNAPYALFGNAGNDYFAGSLPVGSHTLLSTPYLQSYRRGMEGEALSVRFTVVEGAAVAVAASQSQDQFDLSKVRKTSLRAFPNPMIERTTVEFTVAEAGQVLLEVYDMKGSVVRRLYDEEAEAGKVYSLRLERERLPEGFYLCRLVSNNTSAFYRIRVEK
jgi:hypothetical protein